MRSSVNMVARRRLLGVPYNHQVSLFPLRFPAEKARRVDRCQCDSWSSSKGKIEGRKEGTADRSKGEAVQQKKEKGRRAGGNKRSLAPLIDRRASNPISGGLIQFLSPAARVKLFFESLSAHAELQTGGDHLSWPFILKRQARVSWEA